MTTKKNDKTPKLELKPNDGENLPLNKKEKADLKKIAKKVAIDHKGAEKPQLLHVIKGKEKVTLCTIPVVRWALYRESTEINKNTLKTLSAKRETSYVTIEATAAEAKEIKAKFSNDTSKIVEAMIVKFHDDIVKNGWSVSDREAIYLVRRSVLKKLEITAMSLEYDDKVDIKKFFFEASTMLRAVRSFANTLTFYKNAVDEKFLILPDMSKFTVQDRKFVLKSQTYPEKKNVQKKTPAKK